MILSSQPKTLVLRGVTVQALKVASQPQGGIIAARWQTVASLSKPTRFKGEEGFVLFCSDPYFGVEQALLCPGERPSLTPRRFSFGFHRCETAGGVASGAKTGASGLRSEGGTVATGTSSGAIRVAMLAGVAGITAVVTLLCINCVLHRQR